MQSIRVSLSVWLSAVIVIVGLSSGLLYYYMTAGHEKKKFNEYIHKESESLSNDVAVQLWTYDTRAISYLVSGVLKLYILRRFEITNLLA